MMVVMPRTPARVPAELLRRPLRVIRPRDAADVYAYPRPEFARLARAGALHRLAAGYYAIVPDDQVGWRAWVPDLDSAAAGIAAADVGAHRVALMGVSAARVHGVLPGGPSVAVVAAGRHRPALRLSDRPAMVVFVCRDVTRLDVQYHTWDIGSGLVTTIEQTILDLAARPELGGPPTESCRAIAALLPSADRCLLAELALRQRRRRTLERVLGTGAASRARAIRP
jgi:hypothetical protein